MRIIDQTILDKFKAEDYTFAYLLELKALGDVYYRFTNWDTTLKLNDDIYYPRAMEVSPVSYSTSSIVDLLSIQIDDVLQTAGDSLYAVFMGQGHYPFPVKFYIVILDNNYVIPPDGATLFFQGEIDQWEYAPGVVSFKVASIFIQWNNVTTFKYSASCRWRQFGGPECKYPTPEGLICDRTYKVCDETYNNAVNFGGFRWLPSLINKILIPEKKK